MIALDEKIQFGIVCRPIRRNKSFGRTTITMKSLCRVRFGDLPTGTEKIKCPHTMA